MGITIAMLFFIPLIRPVEGVAYFWKTDLAVKWKIAVTGAVAASAAMHFVPPLQTHFLIRLLIRAFVAISIIHMKGTG